MVSTLVFCLCRYRLGIVATPCLWGRCKASGSRVQGARKKDFYFFVRKEPLKLGFRSAPLQNSTLATWQARAPVHIGCDWNCGAGTECHGSKENHLRQSLASIGVARKLKRISQVSRDGAPWTGYHNSAIHAVVNLRCQVLEVS